MTYLRGDLAAPAAIKPDRRHRLHVSWRSKTRMRTGGEHGHKAHVRIHNMKHY